MHKPLGEVTIQKKAAALKHRTAKGQAGSIGLRCYLMQLGTHTLYRAKACTGMLFSCLLKIKDSFYFLKDKSSLLKRR